MNGEKQVTHTNGVNLHVEYAERRRKYGILFIVSLFCEYVNLEYVRVPVIYRVKQAEYVIHIRVAASQEYVNTYSTRSAAAVTPAGCKKRNRSHANTQQEQHNTQHDKNTTTHTGVNRRAVNERGDGRVSPSLSKDQQVTRTRTRQQNTRQQNKPLTRTQSKQWHNDA